MDVTATPRPHLNQRPTQAYYVPRKLLECGRGSQTPKSNDEKPSTTPSSARQKTSLPKPRPLMEKLIEPPTSLKEKLKGQKSRKSLSPVSLLASPPSRSSLSSSNSSASSPSPPLVTNTSRTITTSTPRVVNAKKASDRYSLARPNPFSPTPAQSEPDRCVCDRRNTHVVCKRCGYECVGRVQLTCSIHPLVLALNDLRECANPVCHSIQIVELSDVDNELSGEPIVKIDLLATD